MTTVLEHRVLTDLVQELRGAQPLGHNPLRRREQARAVESLLAESLRLSFAVRLVAAERERQVTTEGWDHRHDDAHDDDTLAMAAVAYAMPPMLRPARRPPTVWPWGSRWWKPSPANRMRELVKAGALIIAEMERLHRASAPPSRVAP